MMSVIHKSCVRALAMFTVACVVSGAAPRAFADGQSGGGEPPRPPSGGGVTLQQPNVDGIDADLAATIAQLLSTLILL